MIVAMNVETEAIMPGIAVNTAKAAEGKCFYSIFCATWIHQCKKMRQKMVPIAKSRKL